jgi:hypothetical protein
VQNLISWKHSFQRLSEEYETAKKKKQALDNLLEAGKISPSTHDMFNMEIAEAITDIERQQKALLQKMDAKMMELKEQIKTLEILLANLEIHHVIGEVDEEVYQREINVLSMGLETSRHELETMREATDQLSSGSIVVEQEAEPQTAENEAAEEELEKPVMQFVKVAETDSNEAQTETLEATQEAQSTDTTPENEEKQEA